MHASDEGRGDVTSLHFGFALSIVAAAMLAISACGDETPREASSTPPSAKSEAPHEAKGLDVKNPLTPAQWLASRGEAQARSVGDAKVAEIDANLDMAHRVYRESERMIANRAMQVSDMLKAAGVEEGADDVLADLAAVVGETGQTEGFGAVAQMYHNLRTSGVSRADALAALRMRYGPGGMSSK